MVSWDEGSHTGKSSGRSEDGGDSAMRLVSSEPLSRLLPVLPAAAAASQGEI